MKEQETTRQIRGEMITLGQLIKLLGLVQTGGEIKEILSGGEFLVNGEPEDRRGRKLYHQDVVTLPDGSRVRIEAGLP